MQMYKFFDMFADSSGFHASVDISDFLVKFTT